MITWVTVWVLTVGYWDFDSNKGGPAAYQIQYATQKTCEVQRKNHADIASYKGFESHERMTLGLMYIPVLVYLINGGN